MIISGVSLLLSLGVYRKPKVVQNQNTFSTWWSYDSGWNMIIKSDTQLMAGHRGASVVNCNESNKIGDPTIYMEVSYNGGTPTLPYTQDMCHRYSNSSSYDTEWYMSSRNSIMVPIQCAISGLPHFQTQPKYPQMVLLTNTKWVRFGIWASLKIGYFEIWWFVCFCQSNGHKWWSSAIKTDRPNKLGLWGSPDEKINHDLWV